MWDFLIKNYVIDPWTLVHVLGMWVVIDVAIRRWGRPTFSMMLLFSMVAIVGWECLEVTFIEPMFGFKEPFVNRYVSDPIAGLIGAVACFCIPRKTM